MGRFQRAWKDRVESLLSENHADSVMATGSGASSGIAALVNQLAAVLMTAVPDDHRLLIEGSLFEVLDLTGDDRARVHEFADDSRECLTTVCVVDRDPDPDEEFAVDAELSTHRISGWIAQLQAGQCVVIEDCGRLDDDLRAERAYFEEQEVTAALLVPLVSRGYLSGCLFLERYTGAGRWSRGVIEQLSMLAEIVACSIEHRRTERYLGRMVRENRELNRRLVEIQEKERRRLAQELHDETGQYLAALKTDVSLVAKRAGDDDPILRDSALAVKESASHIYEVVYSVMGRLCAVDLDDLGLEGGLRACVTNSRLESRGVTCSLNIEGDLNGLEDMIQMSIYRVVQESLTNIVKYAEATQVDVSVRRRQRRVEDRRNRYREETTERAERTLIKLDEVELSVSDDGKGMEPGRIEGGGFGIRGMRERMQALGGSLEVESSPGRGTRITGRIHIGATPEAGHNDA